MTAVPCETCPKPRICVSWGVGCQRRVLAAWLKARGVGHPLSASWRRRFAKRDKP